MKNLSYFYGVYLSFCKLDNLFNVETEQCDHLLKHFVFHLE